MRDTINNFVIGASGLIGGALYESFVDNQDSVVGTYTNNSSNQSLLKLDLLSSDYSSILDQLTDNDNVYILSAYSNPSWIYNNKQKAKELNVTATIKFIEALKVKNPRIIFMSSVEVFDGNKGNYHEQDTPNPLNYYGKLKYEVEKHLINNYKKSTIVRTGWNVGLEQRSRCVVKLTYETLMGHGARMATDNYFSISDVNDTANALRLLSKYPDIPILHICADGIVRRDELANTILKISKNSDLIGYDKCRFTDIPYSEPRGRINDLNNELSKSEIGMEYKKMEDIITQKIKFIDSEYNL